MTQRIIDWQWRPMIVIALLGVFGCGLSEYEKQMDKQRQRIQEFDEGNRALEDPLEIPKLPKGEAAWPFDFFLRLPKGFGSTVKEKEKLPITPQFPCFRYAGPEPGTNLLIVAAILPKIKDVKKPGETASEQFRNSVRETIEEFYARTSGVRLKFPEKVQAQAVEVKRFGPNAEPDERVAFELISYSDTHLKTAKGHVVFQAHFHKDKDSDRQICIIAHRPLPMTNEPAFRKALDISLGTLDISNEATAKRAHFLRVKTAARK